MPSKRRIVGSCIAAAAIAAALAGLVGWVLLLVLVTMIICGLLAIGAEAARPFIRSMHDGKEARPARGAGS